MTKGSLRCFCALLAGLFAFSGPQANDETHAQKLARQDQAPMDSVTFQSPYAPRVNFGARLEPETGIIHGAGQDKDSYLEYSQLFDAAHRPLMFMTYITITAGAGEVNSWREGIEVALRELEGQGTILQIGLNMTTGKDDGSSGAERVASGEYDAAIAAFVDALAAFPVPAYVRIGYEFEGSWNGYSPGGFVSAFRTITDRIREAGLDTVATVWCSAGGSAGFVGFDSLLSFYPGDDYVDWWGVDIFSPEELTHSWLDEFYALASKHQKPVMIGEATPRYVGANQGWHSWTGWYQPFFEMIRKHPEVKAISYINWDWAYWSDALGFSWHDWKDARIQNDDRVSQMYVEEMQQPTWIHAPGLKRVTHP